MEGNATNNKSASDAYLKSSSFSTQATDRLSYDYSMVTEDSEPPFEVQKGIKNLNIVECSCMKENIKVYDNQN